MTYRPFLPCVHSEANSSIFFDFGRIEIVNSFGIQIKWGIRWEEEHAHD